MNSIDQFLNQIRPKQKSLLYHSVYSKVRDLASLKVFMMKKNGKKPSTSLAVPSTPVSLSGTVWLSPCLL